MRRRERARRAFRRAVDRGVHTGTGRSAPAEGRRCQSPRSRRRHIHVASTCIESEESENCAPRHPASRHFRHLRLLRGRANTMTVAVTEGARLLRSQQGLTARSRPSSCASADPQTSIITRRATLSNDKPQGARPKETPPRPCRERRDWRADSPLRRTFRTSADDAHPGATDKTTQGRICRCRRHYRPC
jgi:hypothetical protein